MRLQLRHIFEELVSIENLLAAWAQFIKGKRLKHDVQLFGRHLISNLAELHDDLRDRHYRHGGYEGFTISDPKPRQIHKASVRDRVLHHAVYRMLYPEFDRTFIHDSYSCREDKGTHRAIGRFSVLGRRASGNHHRTCWVLQCDVRKFFASIDHGVLLFILEQYIPDKNLLWLLGEIIGSFSSGQLGKGLPLGNLTSQLLVNVYMNEFDRYVKHTLKAKHYIRYADDFAFLSPDRSWLESLIPHVEGFLRDVLQLSLHPDKVTIRTIASGADFLGWIHFPDHRILRTTTKRRMLRRIEENPVDATVQSYIGMISHGQAYHLREQVLTNYWLWREADHITDNSRPSSTPLP